MSDNGDKATQITDIPSMPDAKPKNVLESIIDGLRSNREEIGHAIVTGSAANDAGSVATYSSIGAVVGLRLHWLLLIATPILIAMNDMCVRISNSTKKGIGALIREEYGFKIAFILVMVLLFSNIAIVAANIAGMSVSAELLTGIDFRFFVIPFAILAWFLVVKGGYKKLEKILLILSLCFLSYILAALLTNPPWMEILKNTLIPNFEFTNTFFLMAVGLLGATISPYVFYYYSGSQVEHSHDLKKARRASALGAIWINFIAFFIITTTAVVLFSAGISIDSAKDAALALQPLVGDLSFVLFAIGLFSASMIAVCVLPISSAYAICETLGYESSLEKKSSGIRFFDMIFIITLASGAIIMFLGVDPIQAMLFSMVISGVFTPFLLFYMVKLANRRDLMGQNRNGWLSNGFGWFAIMLTTVIVLLMFVGFVVGT
ncbi:MAG: divalent metal cation transporter [Candidatus Aenigmatarchaeota archaeon]